jgi:DNA replication protein DnaC
LSHCATLGIPLEATSLDALLSRAEKESLSHLQFLDLLLGEQAGARRERAVARRIRQARFAESKTLESFDWQFTPRAFDRVQIEELATGDFIRRRANLILVGWSGVGKSHVMQALGHLYVRYGRQLGAWDRAGEASAYRPRHGLCGQRWFGFARQLAI